VTGRKSSLEVQPSDTIESVARKIEKEDGIPVSNQRYIYAGKQLERGRTLDSYTSKEKAPYTLCCD
jgi:ubiquitin